MQADLLAVPWLFCWEHHLKKAIRAHHPSLADSLGAVASDLQLARILDVIHAIGSETNLEDET